MLEPKMIEEKIAAALPGADVEVIDTRGSGDHFQARVVWEGFVGKTMIEQHQLVYAPLREKIDGGSLHALALQTYTPEEWAARSGATE